MIFLPIVERELRIAARRRSAFWTRLTAAAIAIALGGWALWFSSDWGSAAGLGRSMFDTLIFVAFLFCLASGPLFTVDTISEEKREGTLGLLFLTDLRGYDVLLGKLAAASMTAVFSLLAILPVLAVPLLLGGVSLEEFACVALALGNALFFSLAGGMLVSVFSQQARSAFAMAVLLLFFFGGFLPWAASLWPAGLGARVAGFILAVLDPGHPFALARSSGFAASGRAFWVSLLANQFVSWGMLAVSAFYLPWAWRDRPAGNATAGWLDRWREWSFGSLPERRAFRQRLLARNPFLWLGSRDRMKLQLLWGFTLLALASWGGCWLVFGRDWTGWGVTLAIAVLLQTPLKWLMASEASHRWVEDQQSGALELWLTTPLPVEEALRGQMQALRRLFGPPALALALAEMLALTLGAEASQFETEAGLIAVVSLVIFAWDLHTLGWLSAWLGLRERKANRALLGALGRILLLPWMVFLLVIFFLGPPGSGTLAFLWLLTCGAVNGWFYLNARGHLRHNLRQVAAGEALSG